MVREPHAPAAGPAEGPQDAVSSAGYAGVARRISRLTINMVATAMVLLLLLLLGQNLGDIWRSSAAVSPRVSPGPSLLQGARDATASIAFGAGQMAWKQSQLVGDAAAAAEELRRVCKVAANLEAADADRPSTEAEQKLLSALSHETPVERLDPQTELFLLAGAAPLAVVTKNGVLAAQPRGLNEAKVAGSRRRVVVWGIALPRGKGAWTVYVFHPQDAADSATLPLPPEAVSILSVRKNGESFTAFRGVQTSRPGSWRAFYDGWAAKHGMKQTTPWTPSEGTWSARFEPIEGQTREQVHIQFGPHGQGGLRGLITTSLDSAAGG